MIGADVGERFRREFGHAGEVSWVPGRVNLIGDHVDYCGGAVLPMAIQFGTSIAVAATRNGRIRCTSANLPDEPIEVRLGAPPPDLAPGSWGRFVVGAVAELTAAGASIDGADVLVAGDIPGSGLSSSASLAVALLYGLSRSAGFVLEPIALVLAAQRIEHRYVGVQCGLMDQAAVMLSAPDCALWFDCFDAGHRAILIGDAVEILVVDSGRQRRLVDSAYNARLRETARAAEQLGVERNQLARIGVERYEAGSGAIADPTVRRRARHVVGEARRVAEAVDALAARDWSSLGRLLDASHASLRDDFAVSCDELDALVELLRAEPGCYGARMTGAGFGGNVVAIFERGRADAASRATPAGTGRGSRPRRVPSSPVRSAARDPSVAERRRNPLTGDWVIVSPSRLQRPWQGESMPPAAAQSNRWEATCHLCPRNARAGGAINPDYRGVFAFDNDFPALSVGGAAPDAGQGDTLLRAEPADGTCRVLCFSERHDVTLATLDDAERAAVVGLWRREWHDLLARHAWVQIFENKGAAMGCSSPHPHGQVWATSHVPTLAEREDEHQRAHTGPVPLLLDYARRELSALERVVARNARWLAVVPFWAAWPFETLLLPLEHRAGFDELDPRDVVELAALIGVLMSAYDRLFDVSFPYSMGWHGRGRDHAREHWQLHAHVYPPLLRSATVRKFMVGFEMLAEAQRDVSPEAAAARLRALVRT